ncbi:MAG: hypothetical protein ACO1SX_03315 [Actinomycetota bacterium]
MGRKQKLGSTVRRPTRVRAGGVTTTSVGCYYFDEEDDSLLVELVLTGPRYLLIPAGSRRFYTTPDGFSPPEEIVPQFILDLTGEELIGSYLHPPAQEWECGPGSQRPTAIRLAFYFPEGSYGGLMGPGGVIPLPDSEPIPERLLRLVWRDL